MNKIAIIETAPIPKNPIDAHVRNAIVLSQELPAILLSKRPSFKEHWNAVVKHIIISYGTLYVDKNIIDEYLNKHSDAKLWFLCNEYNISPNSFVFRDRNWNAIASYDTDIQLQMAIGQGYVPAKCLLGGIVVFDEVSKGKDACSGCECDRLICGGREKKK